MTGVFCFGFSGVEQGSNTDEMISLSLILSPKRGAISRRYSSSNCKKMSPFTLCFLKLSNTDVSSSGISVDKKVQTSFVHRLSLKYSHPSS